MGVCQQPNVPPPYLDTCVYLHWVVSCDKPHLAPHLATPGGLTHMTHYPKLRDHLFYVKCGGWDQEMFRHIFDGWGVKLGGEFWDRQWWNNLVGVRPKHEQPSKWGWGIFTGQSEPTLTPLSLFLMTCPITCTRGMGLVVTPGGWPHHLRLTSTGEGCDQSVNIPTT